MMTQLMRIFILIGFLPLAHAADPTIAVDKGINEFVNTYFSSWSKEDFARYRACFHSSATVTFQDAGDWKQWDLKQFLDDQQSMQSQNHLEEIPLAIHIQARHGDTAFVEVPWKLMLPNSKAITGIDWYVLVRNGQSWQILNLTFWSDNPASAQNRPDSKTKIIVSGFDGFAGRSVNASSEFAKAIRHDFPGSDITFLQVPVVWGAPEEAIAQSRLLNPTVWIAFGEGTQSFQIETVANNRRGGFRDNESKVPAVKEIYPGGPDCLKLDISSQPLVAQMDSLGYNLKVSSNAGSYLCEEMLYSLLHEEQGENSTLKKVMFIHVPIYGSKVQIRGQEVTFSGQNLDTAARDLFTVLADNFGLTSIK
jgi:pyroglutamyl-peptidase